MSKRRLATKMLAALAFAGSPLVGTWAADAPPVAAVTPGRYSCVMTMTPDSYMATQVVTILPSAQYETHGRGAYLFDAAKGMIDFTSGSLAKEGLQGRYIATGVVVGGVPKQKGPAIILSVKGRMAKSNAEYQYCYLATKSHTNRH